MKTIIILVAVFAANLSFAKEVIYGKNWSNNQDDLHIKVASALANYADLLETTGLQVPESVERSPLSGLVSLSSWSRDIICLSQMKKTQCLFTFDNEATISSSDKIFFDSAKKTIETRENFVSSAGARVFEHTLFNAFLAYDKALKAKKKTAPFKVNDKNLFVSNKSGKEFIQCSRESSDGKTWSYACSYKLTNDKGTEEFRAARHIYAHTEVADGSSAIGMVQSKKYNWADEDKLFAKSHALTEKDEEGKVVNRWELVTGIDANLERMKSENNEDLAKELEKLIKQKLILEIKGHHQTEYAGDGCQGDAFKIFFKSGYKVYLNIESCS